MNNTTDASTSTPVAKSSDIPWTEILVPFYIVVLILTVLGNTLVCAAIYVDRRLRSPTNWFIASLAVSDLFYALAGLPFRITSHVTTIQQLSICKAWIWVDMICVAASIASLAVISVDRHLKITKPFDYHRRMTTRRSFLAIGAVWAYAAILSTLSIISWPGAKGVVLKNGFCSNNNQRFYTVATIVAFLLPLLVLVASYSMILRTAWIQFTKMQLINVNLSSKEDKRKQKSVRRDFKATKTLAIVLGSFTLCWGPFFIVFTISQYDSLYMRHIPDVRVREVVFYLIILILPNLNSTLNPIIYAYFNVEYRRAFQKIMLSICGKQVHTYGSGKRRSSLTSFFQTAFARRATPPTPSDDGNHNHHGSNDDQQSFLNGDTCTQISHI